MAGGLTHVMRHGVRHQGIGFEQSEENQDVTPHGRKLEQYVGQRTPFMQYGM